MLPPRVLLDFLKPDGAGREILKNLYSGATAPFRVGV
jgi:hypothetical protein